MKYLWGGPLLDVLADTSFPWTGMIRIIFTRDTWQGQRSVTAQW
jgi:hypothetical protein